MSNLEKIKEALIDGKDAEVKKLTSEALTGNSAADILDNGLIAGMEVIGERFSKREIFLPTVLLAARAMNAGIELLEPHLKGKSSRSRGAVVIGSVEGDLHDIGKNLVGIMLKGAGFEVIDLGNSVSPDAFIEAAKEKNAKIIGMSALLTTTMPVMSKVVSGLKEAGLDVKTLVGGAPVSEEFAKKIGADGYGYDAANAVEVVKAWAQ